MGSEAGGGFDTLNDALRSAVMALGGFKKVGGRLRPDDESADDWLRHCLNGGRRERLSPEQAIWLLREARNIGFHAAMDYLALSTGYKAVPVDSDAVRHALQLNIAAGMEKLQQQMAALQRLTETAST